MQDQPTHLRGAISISRSSTSRLLFFLPTSSTLTAPPYASINQSHLTSNHLPFRRQLRFSRRFRIHNPQKCLPKLLRRSQPLVAKPQLVRLPRTRKRLARRQQPLHQVIRRSEARRGRRLIPATSTKVCLASLIAKSLSCSSSFGYGISAH